MRSDLTYLITRASEERDAAKNAVHPIARQKHLELASRYQEMADDIVEPGKSAAAVQMPTASCCR